MDFREIQELVKTIDQTSVTEVELEYHGVKVKIRKAVAFASNQPSGAKPEVVESKVEQPVYTSPEIDIIPTTKKEQTTGPNQQLIEITAPMVGTFYRAPSPDSPPFVNEGDLIKLGQSLCIIEAMKLMNEIEAEYEGKLVEVLVENGQVVEYGQPLFLLEPGK